MNTPTPAQALADVMALSENAMPGRLIVERYYRDGGGQYICIRNEAWTEAAGEHGICEKDAELFAAAVNFIRQHGQHFAGLEAENSTAIADVARLLSRTVELNDALDSADARVLELKSALLRYGRHEEVCETRHDTAYKPKPKCTCGFAAFIASGETK